MRGKKKAGAANLLHQLQPLNTQRVLSLRFGSQSAYIVVKCLDLRRVRAKPDCCSVITWPDSADRFGHRRAKLQPGVAGIGSVIRKHAVEQKDIRRQLYEFVATRIVGG